ncbi:MAG: four-carbon acid sugar kinase family protein [Pseudomonadota bacterium]
MAVDGTLKIAFYGDDFTGATDTLATAARAGLRTMLFLGLPGDAHLKEAGALDCLGIAGAARAMSPAEMQVELMPVGEFFASLKVPVTHYKTCSTFDSAPHIGSIGAAIRLLQPYAGNTFVPILGGQPNLRRYCVFSHLFAAAGDGIYRIDRHPTMRRHPVTPMAEADLRLHLQQQGLRRVDAVHCPDYGRPAPQLDQQLEALLAQQPDAVLFDVAQVSDLAVVGRLVWQRALQQRLLAVGASSVVQALAAHWGGGSAANEAKMGPAEGPVLMLAGSLSPMTARQVQAAVSYDKVLLDASQLAQDSGYRSRMAGQIAAQLGQGRHVMVCTSTREVSASLSLNGRVLAQAGGDLLAQVLHLTPVKRLGIAGGDTSSHAVQALDAWGLSYMAQLAPGVALCRLHSDVASLDGMELMLKGGQVGGEQLFEELLSGNH